MSKKNSWLNFWQERIADYDVLELSEVVTSHKCVTAKRAAIELIDLDNIEYDDSKALLSQLNYYMPSDGYIVIACDQMIHALNRIIDEHDCSDWYADLDADYQRASYFGGR